MILMPILGTKAAGRVRTIVLAASLLVPFAACAGGLEHHASGHAGHSATQQRGDITAGIRSGHYTAPVKTPQHCHEQSPTPQATAPLQRSLTPDPSPPIAEGVLAPPGSARLRLSLVAARPLITGPPGYILFGNFRS
jgi:hypothetical protein